MVFGINGQKASRCRRERHVRRELDQIIKEELRSETKFSGAIESAVRAASLSAPQSKPGYLLALVQGLRTDVEVPPALVLVLQALAKFASGEG
jgi:hypothetical protein